MKELASILLQFSKKTMISAVVAGVLSGLGSAVLLALINGALNAGAEGPTPLQVWGFVALCILVPLVRILSGYLLSQMGQEAVFDLRMKLSRQILASPLRSLEKHGSHRLLVALTRDIGAVAIAIANLPILSIYLAMVVGSLVYLGWLSWKSLLIVLAFIVLGVLTYRVAATQAERRVRKAREEANQLYKHFETVTQGTKELKLHQLRGRDFMRSLEGTGRAHMKFNLMSGLIFRSAAAWAQFLLFAVIGLLVFVVPAFLDLDMAALTGYALVLLYLMTPLQGMVEVVPDVTDATVAIRKVNELGLSLTARDAANEEDRLEEARRPTWKGLELKAVRLSYESNSDGKSAFTLGPLDLALKPGELLFLVGGNGSGKTTLAKLITGLYEPEAGEIRFDGEPVTDENRAAYRQNFSAVFADFYLFDQLLGLRGPGSDERAREFLGRLELEEKVAIEDGRLSTTDLSQGQRKRLALLTAFLEDRPIYIFDEWAADQDSLFRETFYYQILPELKERGKAVVVISHDDRYYQVSDRIVKLDYGQLAYDGVLEGLQYAGHTA